MRKVFMGMALAALVLTGCSTMNSQNKIEKLDKLDASTYRLTVMQPWVKEEFRAREVARNMADEVCGAYGQGMQPLSATSDRPATPEMGASVSFIFRCVGFVAGPTDEGVLRRLGFYSDEQSRQEALKEMEEYDLQRR